MGSSRLNLSNAGLRELPREVFALADTLEVLDLSDNALDGLPDELPRLLRLKVLFCSDNRFAELPAVLGQCPQLEMIACRNNAITHIATDALPPTLRWLTLTNNRIAALPDSIGRCRQLQKLMLAGNRLRQLPASMASCQGLELLRLAANDFQTAHAALPDWLLALPQLAWLAHAGNPFSAPLEAQRLHDAPARRIHDTELHFGARLGEGASGVVHEALWQPADAPPRHVAVKRFKGAMTSDGLPHSEMAACLAAGAHPQIVAVEGRLIDTALLPDESNPATHGLVLRRIPPGYVNLGRPPSLASCTRDVYADDQRFSAARALRIGTSIASALAHLHARGVMHGDLYAHNIVVDPAGDALLGDFGAASFLPPHDEARSRDLRRLDLRALGVLIDELAARCDEPQALDALRASLAG